MNGHTKGIEDHKTPSDASPSTVRTLLLLSHHLSPVQFHELHVVPQQLCFIFWWYQADLAAPGHGLGFHRAAPLYSDFVF